MDSYGRFIKYLFNAAFSAAPQIPVSSILELNQGCPDFLIVDSQTL